jgi:hypothetical protein
MKNKLLFVLISLFTWAGIQAQTYTTGVINLSTTPGLAMTAKIDVTTQVTLTLTGPAGRWFALGFNAGSMANGTDVVAAHSSGTLSSFDAKLTGYTAPTTDPQQDWTISSDVVVGTTRTIIATRALNTNDANDYTFNSIPSNISMIWARANSSTFSYSYHGNTNRGITLATFTLLPPPTPPAAPTGQQNQTFCSGATLAQLAVTGTSIQWYAFPTGGAPLPTTTPLVNGTTYYASQTVNGLESISRLAVTATVNTAPATPSSINGSSSFCYNAAGQTFFINAVNGASSYVWTTPNGSTGSSTGTNISLLFGPSFQTGTLSVLAQNNCGQSSPVSVTLQQYQASAQTFSASACNAYTWNGQTYTQSGSYNYSGQTIHGCDSVVVLELSIANTIEVNLTEAACGSYAWNNQNYFQSGIYIDSAQSLSGCDSITTLNLTIYPIEAIVLDTTVLDVFTWNNIEYFTSGSYTQFFISSFGCDSSVTINVTIDDSGLQELSEQLSIYPNPVKSTGELFIKDVKNELPFVIHSMLGERKQIGLIQDSIITLESLPIGIYILEIQDKHYPFIVD